MAEALLDAAFLNGDGQIILGHFWPMLGEKYIAPGPNLIPLLKNTEAPNYGHPWSRELVGWVDKTTREKANGWR